MTALINRMDLMGKPVLIAMMIGGFILFWPIGLAILAYLIWSGRMACGDDRNWAGRREAWMADKQARFETKMARWQEKLGMAGGGGAKTGSRFAPTGNRAFDEYREDMLRRLEQEASEFEGFLERLRMARDKAEFDQYMAERRGPAAPGEDARPVN
jgi:hypothetical protein